MTTPGKPSSATHLPALDGLRFLCAAWVVVGHSFVFHPWAPFMSRLSGAGVDIFFALSGFLITRILLVEKERYGEVNLWNFYVRRSLRIWPLYYLAIAIALVGTLVLGARFTRPLGIMPEAMDLGAIALRYGLFAANVFPTPVPTPLDVLWSICVEEQFYLIMPLCWVRSRSAAPVLPFVAIGMALAWGTRLVLARIDPGAIYRNPLAHADHLLLGTLLAQLVSLHGDKVTNLAQRAGSFADVGVLAGLLGLVASGTGRTLGPFGWWATYVLSAVLCTALVWLLAYGRGVMRTVFSKQPFAFLGTLTYAAYVFHNYPLTVGWAIAARVAPRTAFEVPLRATLALLGTFAVAYASKRLLEDRILALKERFVR